ncbi:MAG: hypothetical protein IPK80_28825 [Nannocystis sp.]|nr:hypothetical protein [Nannocystis sp.]
MTSWEVRIPNSAAFWGLVCRLQPKRLVFIEVLRVDKALAILKDLGLCPTWSGLDELQGVLIPATRSASSAPMHALKRSVAAGTRRHFMARRRGLSLEHACTWVQCIAPERVLRATTSDPALALAIGAAPVEDPPSDRALSSSDPNCTNRASLAEARDLCDQDPPAPPIPDPQTAHEPLLDRQIAPASKSICDMRENRDFSTHPGAVSHGILNEVRMVGLAEKFERTAKIEWIIGDDRFTSEVPAGAVGEALIRAFDRMDGAEVRVDGQPYSGAIITTMSQLRRQTQAHELAEAQRLAKQDAAQELAARAEHDRSIEEKRRELAAQEQRQRETQRQLDEHAPQMRAEQAKVRARKHDLHRRERALEASESSAQQTVARLIADAERTAADKIRDAERDASAKIRDAERQLADANKEILDRRRQAERELAEQRRDVERELKDMRRDADRELKDARTELDKGQRALEENRRAFDQERAEFNENRSSTMGKHQQLIERTLQMMNQPDHTGLIHSAIKALLQHLEVQK